MDKVGENVNFFEKNSIKKCDNRLGKIRQEKLELKNRLQELDELEENELVIRRNVGIKKYISEEKRRRLLDEAERLGYSHKEIEILRVYVKDWNVDNVSNEIIDSFENLETYIAEQAPYKNNPLYFIGNIVCADGGRDNVN